MLGVEPKEIMPKNLHCMTKKLFQWLSLAHTLFQSSLFSLYLPFHITPFYSQCTWYMSQHKELVACWKPDHESRVNAKWANALRSVLMSIQAKTLMGQVWMQHWTWNVVPSLERHNDAREHLVYNATHTTLCLSRFTAMLLQSAYHE